jgi:D-amino-acid dehydrogenase
MKVIVLGAGVIGVTSAYFLGRAGHQVVVLEKNTEAGLGCSYANGGQLSYSHVETWAAKASFFSMTKAAIMPGSFLTISDFASKNFLKWLREFYKNSSPKNSQENSRRLFRLTSYSKEVLAEIMKEEKDLKFDYKNNGILHFYRDIKKFDAAIKEAEFHNSIGCKAQILNAEECIKKEPTLVKLFDEKKLAGGIFYEIDASGNSFLFTKALEKICREKYGVVFEYGAEVKNILTNHKKITGINSSKGVFVANKYVYAMGVTGDRLLRGINIHSKIYPLKGYSLSIAANEEFIAPSLALTDCENKIVYSRLGDVFRAAGTVEICGLKANKSNKHISFLRNSIRATFSDFGNFNDVSDWFGFRPFRPNSIPLICEVKKYGNLVLNTGHGSLGWTLSAASGKILADLVSDQKDERFGFLEEEEEEINS